MAFTTPNVGETALLGYMLNKTEPTDVKIHLYENDVTPGEGDIIDDYTLITDPAAITLAGTSWSITDGTASFAQQTFEFSGQGIAHGYVITDSTGAVLLFAEDFSDGPYSIPDGGGTVKVTPSISLS